MTKRTVTYTVDVDVADNFADKTKGRSKSYLVQEFMRTYNE